MRFIHQFTLETIVREYARGGVFDLVVSLDFFLSGFLFHRYYLYHCCLLSQSKVILKHNI